MTAKRILVIDDEPNVIRLCQRALGKEGFEVKGALSGKEGLHLLKGRSPELASSQACRGTCPEQSRRAEGGNFDLTLLDIKLPDRDGLDVLSTIMEMDPETAVVIIAGCGTMEVAIRALKLGAQDFLLKPFTTEELMASVQRVLEKRRLLQENLRLKARLPILEISKALISEVNLERLTQLTLATAQYTLGANRVSLMLLDEERQELSISAALGLSDEVVTNTRVKVGQGLAGLAAQMRKPILLPDQVENDPAIQASLTQSDTGSAICVPLMLKDRVLGVLNASRPLGSAPFRRDDVGLLSILCGQIAVALENARLFEQAQWEIAKRKRMEEEIRHRNEELMALNAIATTIGQSLDLDHILNATLDKVLEVIEIDAGWIQLLDEDAGVLSLVAHRGFSQEMAEEIRMVKLGESMTGQVAQSGQLIVVDGTSEDPRLSIETARRETLHAFAGVPIKSKDKVLGVLGVFSRSPRQLSSQKVQLLAATGHQIGVAIESVRLAEKASEIEILRELNRLRSELIANVSHELRTPLGLIKIFCTTLLREDVNFDHEIQREFLHDIEEEVDKLEKIVDNLLELSQMKDGRLRLDKRPTDVGQLARKVMETVQVQPTQHRFVHDFPSDPLVATVDPKRIEQVLRNLLSNAIKYSPEGGTITVQGRGDKRQLLIWVSDQGMGIPSQDLERIFERFYRVENEITQKVRGVGLGLAVCRGIAEAHGGRIWAESILGVGSTFYFTLPAGARQSPELVEGSESHSDQPQQCLESVSII
ncbi:MAG: GAF domain-containing protein [Anaerolineae bacterium]|nr:GAF domain-containing protein [Anaerolineae bacterium]